MKPEEFLDNLGTAAAAAGGTKRLREMVLDLAMRGDLVGQTTTDGSAEEVVALLAKARRTIPAGRGVESLPDDVEPVDPPFPLPPAWRWARLADLGTFVGGGTPSKSNSAYWTGKIPWVSPKDMKRPYIGDAEDHISDAALEDSAAKLIPSGALLFVTRGMILAHSFPTALTTREVTINQDMKALVVFVPAMGEYLLRACQAARRRMLQRVERSSHGTCRLDTTDVGNLPIPLPPLKEQKRIVAKVDQLMALCDDLEAKQTKKRDLATQSTRSALTALASAERGAELSLAWRRVASGFQTFVSTPDDARNLRGAVAELATRGLLTAQSEKERPAAELTAKLDAASVGDTDTLPLLPSNWLWARLADLLAFGPKNGYSPKAVEHPTDVKALTLSATTSGRFAPQYFKYIDEKIPKDSDLWLRDGDVLIQRGNTLDYVGIAAVYRGRDAEFIYPDLMIKIRAADFVDVDFLHLALNARPTRDYFKAHASGTSGTMPKINQSVLLETPIPVPPLAEQKRIVTKVDHLMSLLDDLEAKLRKQEETATRLAESLAAAVAA